MQNYLILIVGLPGTGKTTLARSLSSSLGYELLSQNNIRREMGMKKMPANGQDDVLRRIDKKITHYLLQGKGVVLESVHRYQFRRQQIYGIASGCGTNAVTLECICSEEEAKRRMRQRPVSDGLVSDPGDPAVYDKMAATWHSVEEDFSLRGIDFVSHVVYNSELKNLERKRIALGMEKFIKLLEKTLLLVPLQNTAIDRHNA